MIHFRRRWTKFDAMSDDHAKVLVYMVYRDRPSSQIPNRPWAVVHHIHLAANSEHHRKYHMNTSTSSLGMSHWTGNGFFKSEVSVWQTGSAESPTVLRGIYISKSRSTEASLKSQSCPHEYSCKFFFSWHTLDMVSNFTLRTANPT